MYRSLVRDFGTIRRDSLYELDLVSDANTNLNINHINHHHVRGGDSE